MLADIHTWVYTNMHIGMHIHRKKILSLSEPIAVLDELFSFTQVSVSLNLSTHNFLNNLFKILMVVSLSPYLRYPGTSKEKVENGFS